MKSIKNIAIVAVLAAAPFALANDYLNQFPFESPRTGTVRGSLDHRTEARFSSNSSLASGKAKYRERTNGNTIQQRFSIEVEDATPGDALAVVINGNLYGMIVVNDLGMGELQFRTAEFIDDPGDGDPIPSEFPRIDPGAKISVGDMNGTFQLR